MILKFKVNFFVFSKAYNRNCRVKSIDNSHNY